MVDSDETIRESGEQLLSDGVPGEGGTGGSLRLLSSGSLLEGLSLDVGDGLLAGVDEIPDLDSVLSSDGDPLHLGVEGDGVDDSSGLVESGVVREIRDGPDLELLVSSSGGDVGGEGGDAEGVDVSVVSLEGVSDLELGVPDLESSVPTGGGEEGVLAGRRVSEAADPVGVVVLLRGVLALSVDVPELDGSVGTRGDDLSVVEREGAGQSLSGVSDEGSGGDSRSEVPQSEGLVPRGGEGVVVVGTQGDVRHEVVVSGEGSVGGSVESLGVVLSLIGVELPDHDGSVSGAGDKDGGVLVLSGGISSNDGGDPSAVSLEESCEVDVGGSLLNHLSLCCCL